jgi:integrase
MKECMAERDGLGLNVRHVREMRRNLKSFSIGRETRSVCEITAAECRDWLGSHGWGQQTKRNVYVRVAAFFNWAVAQKYLSDSPWKGVIKPGESDSPIGILTPDEARKCLAHVATADPGLLSYYAIGMFAGIRPAEMERLTPANFQDGFIVLREDQTKTGKRRLVEVTPTLAAWLKFSPTLPPWRNLKHRIEDVRKAMGIAWPKNCMRHSFCSYAMALPDWGATRTSKSAGNSEKVMLECYQELVRPVAAAKFWASTPDVVLGAPTNIVPMATAV